MNFKYAVLLLNKNLRLARFTNKDDFMNATYDAREAGIDFRCFKYHEREGIWTEYEVVK